MRRSARRDAYARAPAPPPRGRLTPPPRGGELPRPHPVPCLHRAVPDPPDADRRVRRVHDRRRPVHLREPPVGCSPTTSSPSAFVTSIQLAVATAIAGRDLRRPSRLGGRPRRSGWPSSPARDRRFGRPRPVRRRHARVRLPGDLRGSTASSTLFFPNILHVDLLSDASWLYSLAGLAVVYTYFQIPLMLIVFLPSLDGLRQEWYDASASLGGGGWSFWRHVGGPDPRTGLPRRAAAPLHERVLRLRDGGGARQPGQPAHHPPDRRPAAERDRARPGERRQGAGARDDRHRRRS